MASHSRSLVSLLSCSNQTDGHMRAVEGARSKTWLLPTVFGRAVRTGSLTLWYFNGTLKIRSALGTPQTTGYSYTQHT